MQEPIYLLVLTHNYPRYKGDYAGIFIQLLCRKLVSQGISPIVLAPHDNGAAEYEENEGIKIYRFHYAPTVKEQTIAYRGQMHNLVLKSVSGIFKFKNFLDSFKKSASEIIEKEKIDIIAGHWLVPSGLVMKQLAKKYDIPMIISSHGTDVRLMKKYYKVVYRYLKSFTRKLKCWTVVSSFLRDELLNLDSSLKQKLEILPLPHDESIFFEDKSVAKESNLITAVTRFTDQKRVDVLIKAFALLSEINSSARLEIYGSGPLEDNIKNDIDRFKLKGKVKIYEPVSQVELRKIYNKSSVVVLNSVEEGFGLALSEAMLCRTAVIGTDSGGIVDIIENEKTGLLVEADNAPALSGAMFRLLSDGELRMKLADNGYQQATKNYASSSLAKRYAEIIRVALKD